MKATNLAAGEPPISSEIDVRHGVRRLLASIVVTALHGVKRGVKKDIEYCQSQECQAIIEALGIPPTCKMADIVPKIQSGELKLSVNQLLNGG